MKILGTILGALFNSLDPHKIDHETELRDQTVEE